jgi:phospholipid transport system transporter-binding protein|tara:strand:+ start:81 stop:386 length:306 start_codon:yes stop_codon:yes gene_type:complete
MNQTVSISLEASSKNILVSGELSFATVASVLNEVHDIGSPLSVLNIDLLGVTLSDSAGLALLVHWVRMAKTTNKQIFLHHIPEQILEIVSASGLDELLPVA